MASNTNVREMIAKNNAKKGGFSDKIVPIILGIIAAISILTTIGILFTLITETITFFTRVSITEFLFTKDWSPTSSDPKYGIWALILGTLKITFIGTLVA
ncbi:phosphate ABC transporter permease subunit PstC, partial [Staphylococcus lugdunensis]